MSAFQFSGMLQQVNKYRTEHFDVVCNRERENGTLTLLRLNDKTAPMKG